jgi:hypothetical protein
MYQKEKYVAANGKTKERLIPYKPEPMSGFSVFVAGKYYKSDNGAESKPAELASNTSGQEPKEKEDDFCPLSSIINKAARTDICLLSSIIKNATDEQGSVGSASVEKKKELAFDEKYNARFVGFLHISVTDTIEKLYDVFDGDREDKKLFKKQTKELFEKGVSLYCQKEFYEARLVFIEVLKQFRQDAAAKEYLYRCDRYYQSPDTDDTDIFIESY